MVQKLAVSDIAQLTPVAAGTRRDDPAKVRDAAQQFEALLLAQILRAVRESEGTWLGGGGSGDCATELAEQHLAAAMAASGGLHLADLIASGLTPRAAADPPEAVKPGN